MDAEQRTLAADQDEAATFYGRTAKRMFEAGVNRKRFGEQPSIDLLLQVLSVDGVNYTVSQIADEMIEARRSVRILAVVTTTLAAILIAMLIR